MWRLRRLARRKDNRTRQIAVAALAPTAMPATAPVLNRGRLADIDSVEVTVGGCEVATRVTVGTVELIEVASGHLLSLPIAQFLDTQHPGTP